MKRLLKLTAGYGSRPDPAKDGDREVLKGASNQGYHYLGSAKIMAQIGKAFAEAMVKE